MIRINELFVGERVYLVNNYNQEGTVQYPYFDPDRTDLYVVLWDIHLDTYDCQVCRRHQLVRLVDDEDEIPL